VCVCVCVRARLGVHVCVCVYACVRARLGVHVCNFYIYSCVIFLFWILCVHVCAGMCVGVLSSVICVCVYPNQTVRFLPSIQTGTFSNLD